MREDSFREVEEEGAGGESGFENDIETSVGEGALGEVEVGKRGRGDEEVVDCVGGSVGYPVIATMNQ